MLVPTSAPLLAGGKPTQQPSSSHQETFEDFMDFCMFPAEPQHQQPQQQAPQPHQQQQFDFSSPSSPEAMLVSTTFDEWIDSTVLQISSPTQSHSSAGKTMLVKSPSQRSARSSIDQFNGTDIYNFPNAFSSTPHMSSSHLASTIDANQSALANLRLESSLTKPLPRIPGELGLDTANRYFQNGTTYADFATLAINFILAYVLSSSQLSPSQTCGTSDDLAEHNHSMEVTMHPIHSLLGTLALPLIFTFTNNISDSNILAVHISTPLPTSSSPPPHTLATN